MIQKNFTVKTPVAVGAVIIEIKKLLAATPHRGALLTIYEAGYPEKPMKIMVNKIRKAIPELKIAGISVFTVVAFPPDGTGIQLNLLITESSDFEVVSISCGPGEEDLPLHLLRDQGKRVTGPQEHKRIRKKIR